MPVKEADPNAKALDVAFREAMEGPAKPREVPAPPPVDHEAPHGRDADGKPIAKYGYTKDGAVRRSPAGRPPKDQQARVIPAQPAAPPPAAPAQALPPQDFSAKLMDAGETIWFGGSLAAKVGPQVPIVGKMIFGGKINAGPKLSATMAVFDLERPRLAAALNLAAQHDARARKLAGKLADGEAGWALSVMFMVAPFTSAVAAIWQGDEALAERELPNLAELAKRNDEAMDRMLAKITAQMEQAQALQAAQMQAEMEAAMAAQVNGEVAHAPAA